MSLADAIGQSIYALSTPVPIIDQDIMTNNIARVQTYMDKSGLDFRPHIKTHKIPDLARAQIDAGAKGINCQKISEAEIFADAGFDDILITFNILGPEKLARLATLADRVKLSVVADSETTVRGLSTAFTSKNPLTVFVECDTGGTRCGVQTPVAACALAALIHADANLSFGGLLTFPASFNEEKGDAYLKEACALLADKNIPCPVISYGGSPSLFNAHLVSSATEYRAGTYIYNDRSLIRAGHCTEADCAMTILATIVSRPAPDRAVLDAGSKALTSDLLGFNDHGLITAYPKARIDTLSEEHAVVDLSACGKKRPEIGEKVQVIPNHTCVVSNMFDQIVFHKDGTVTDVKEVAARGRVW
jgi:D-serine deaminase-like pyridoxal phosphate-dependent protein